MLSIATAQLHNLAFGYPIACMQTIAETRRQRLQMLLAKHNNSLAELNEALGLDRTDSTLSQIRNQSAHSRTGKPRSMGDDLARKIEKSLGLEEGWMDTPPTYAELLGEEDPMTKAILALEQLNREQIPVATRLITAIAQPEKKLGNGE